MSELPSGWALAELKEVADLSPKLNANELDETQAVHFVPMAAVAENFGGVDVSTLRPLCEVRKGYTSFVEGDVLFAKITPCMENGKGGLVPHLSNRYAFGSTEFHVFRPGAAITSQWLAHFLSQPNFRITARQNMTGSAGQLRVPARWLQTVVLPVPPLAEQTRIVEKLDALLSELDAGVAELKAAQIKLAQYRQALLKAAVDGTLTAEWRKQNKLAETGAQLLARILEERRKRWTGKKKYVEPAGAATEGLTELPEGWVWASVDECLLDEKSITDGPFGSNLKSLHYRETGPRVIRLQNIGEGHFIDAKAYISDEHYKTLEKHAFEDGDVIIAMLGENLPRACLVPLGTAPGIVKADCARVRINPNLVLPALLVAQLNSKPIRDTVVRWVKGIGRPRINLRHIRSIPVALPSMDEQIQINAALTRAQDAIDEQVTAIDLALKRSAAQRQNILKAAFSGQLVPQDPNDEPASALLERIRAARGQTPKPRGRTGGKGKR